MEDNDDFPQRQSGMSNGVKVLIACGALFALLIVCGGLGAVLAVPAIQQSREAARRAEARRNLDQLGQALRNYQEMQRAIDLRLSNPAKEIPAPAEEPAMPLTPAP